MITKNFGLEEVMKRLITIGLVLATALPAIADEKVRSVPERKAPTELMQALQKDALNKYHQKAKLDLNTYYQFQDFMTMHEDETIRNTQLAAGTLLSAAGGYGMWKSFQNRAKDATGKPIDTAKLKLLRAASMIAIAGGVYQLGAGALSHSMVWGRDQQLKKRMAAFINTPLERAMRAQIGQKATDELLADFIASGDDPEKTMAISWVEQEDLEWLAKKTEEAKAKYLPLLGDHDGQYYIKDADRREFLAEYYGTRRALLELQLRDESKENASALSALMEAQFQQSLTKIKKEVSQWNEETANLLPHADSKVQPLNGKEAAHK